MRKINKREIIKRLVVEPKTQKRFFWAKEMKLLNSLMEMFPDLDFWAKVSIRKVPSLAVIKSQKGLKILNNKYREFNYKIPEKKEIQLGDKTGKNIFYSKKNKTIRQFIDE